METRREGGGKGRIFGENGDSTILQILEFLREAVQEKRWGERGATGSRLPHAGCSGAALPGLLALGLPHQATAPVIQRA